MKPAEPNLETAGRLSDSAFANALLAATPQLRGYARGLCRSASHADDLVQDALMKAWAARDRFQAGTHFQAWMIVILRNSFFSGLRRKKFEQEATGNEPEIVAPAAQPGHMELIAVRDALEKLPAPRREALLLVGAVGMSYQEAATICGCAVGTIKSRVSRARSDLLALINGEPLEPDSKTEGHPRRRRARQALGEVS